MSGLLRGIASIEFVAGVPQFAANSGAFRALVDNAPGDTSADSSGTGSAPGENYDALASCILTSPRLVGAPPADSLIRSCGLVHTTDNFKVITSLTEGVAGAVSALADDPYDVAILGPGKLFNGLQILDAGSISFPAGVPTYGWRGGAYAAALGDTAVGQIAWTWGNGGVDLAACAVICTPRVALVASGLTSVHVAHTSDTAKVVAIYQEAAAGGASVPADVAFDFVIFGRRPAQANSLVDIHALGSVVSGAGPTFRRPITSGEFADAGVVRAGAGLYDLTLGPGFGVDADACAIVAAPRIAAAASENRSIGVVHTSDNVKRFTLLQEGAAGGASVLADFDFDFAIVKRQRG